MSPCAHFPPISCHFALTAPNLPERRAGSDDQAGHGNGVFRTAWCWGVAVPRHRSRPQQPTPTARNQQAPAGGAPRGRPPPITMPDLQPSAGPASQRRSPAAIGATFVDSRGSGDHVGHRCGVFGAAWEPLPSRQTVRDRNNQRQLTDRDNSSPQRCRIVRGRRFQSRV